MTDTVDAKDVPVLQLLDHINQEPCTFTNAKQEVISPSDCAQWVHGKWLAVYFTASWCRPCLAFTPVLTDFLTTHDTRVAGILVPFDKDPVKAAAYFADKMRNMLSVHQDNVESLAVAFGASTIPHLVFISPEGKVQRADGRAIVNEGRTPW